MVMPLEALHILKLDLPEIDPDDLIKSLNSIHALACHCEILPISKLYKI